MMARTNRESINDIQIEPDCYLKVLYPGVNETETPLPRGWSTRERSINLCFTKANKRVEYKGVGKKKDAFNINTSHPIPPSCGIYYFEVKIINKGQEGHVYIGILTDGLKTNKLPVMDKLTYGYRGDDGCIHFSNGAGQRYGPTFTTGDVVGCGVNFLDRTCFFTKNGHNLGTAFKDLQDNVYPTVGLQMPGVIIETNFGTYPFIFDIVDMMQGVKKQIHHTIEKFPVSENGECWHTLLQSIVQSYLIHHGYYNTAKAFADSTHQTINEDPSSIKKRQSIQKLLLSGEVSEAIKKTKEVYPELLEKDINLQFMLECRNFIEELSELDNKKTSTTSRYGCSNHYIKRHNSEKAKSALPHPNTKLLKVESDIDKTTKGDLYLKHWTRSASVTSSVGSQYLVNNFNEHSDVIPMVLPVSMPNTIRSPIKIALAINNSAETNISDSKRKCRVYTEKILTLGRKLNTMKSWMKSIPGYDKINDNMLQNAFSLIAYNDPLNSPLGYLLHQSERELICDKTNSAILEHLQFPRRSVLEITIIHVRQLINLMFTMGHGYGAFISVDDLLH